MRLASALALVGAIAAIRSATSDKTGRRAQTRG